MKKSEKIEELRAADSEAEQLEGLLDTEDTTQPIPDRDSEGLKGLLDAVNNAQPLPASGTELILLEVDPHRAHAYWNIDPAEAQSSLPLVLRVYDITESGSPETASQAFDVEVQGLQGRWYLDFWRDDRTFVSEIGYREANGAINVIARSNEVQTPRAEPVDSEAVGQHVDHKGDPLHTEWPGDRVQDADEQAVEVVNSAVVDALEASAQSAAKLAEEFSVAQEEPINVEPITILDAEFPISEWSNPLDSLLEDEVAESSVTEEGPDTVMAAGDASIAFEDEVMTGPEESESDSDGDVAVGDSPALDEHFPSAEELTASITENHVALQAFYESAGPEIEQVDGGSDEPSPNEGDGYQSESDRPQSEPPPEGLPPLEQVVGLSSMENANKDVLLEVNAELHIYGRSKPNTELTLYGQVVKTRPDGTFSVRRILPHGAVVLPLLYTNKEE